MGVRLCVKVCAHVGEGVSMCVCVYVCVRVSANTSHPSLCFTAPSKPYVTPQRTTTAGATATPPDLPPGGSAADVKPRFDPDAPDALVMQRPGQAHQVREGRDGQVHEVREGRDGQVHQVREGRDGGTGTSGEGGRDGQAHQVREGGMGRQTDG